MNENRNFRKHNFILNCSGTLFWLSMEGRKMSQIVRKLNAKKYSINISKREKRLPENPFHRQPLLFVLEANVKANGKRVKFRAFVFLEKACLVIICEDFQETVSHF